MLTLLSDLFPFITVGLAANEGLKSVDIRNNNITAKGMHAMASCLRTNITLLELYLSETETLLVTGDDIIIGDAETSPAGQQGDQAKIEKLLESNNTLSKVNQQIFLYLYNSAISCNYSTNLLFASILSAFREKQRKLTSAPEESKKFPA